ncbi:hypothetical protein [Nocardioides zeicaulis]|uniref:Uncharacterized protein n=1 Tax=Nocardioides zeicaulis TaxID=1776857 RepID=A0ABV6DWS3_9ACTN
MPQTVPELLNHLDEQLAFIDASCSAFDDGIEYECKRLATHVRTLVHDTGRSRSLLALLQAKDRLWFHDSIAAKRERISAFRAAGAIPAFMGGLMIVEMGDQGTRYVPHGLEPSTSDELRMTRFEEWWREPAMFPTSGPAATRYDLMDWLAHKDGGSHIDELPPTYVALTTGNAMGARFDVPAGLAPARNSPIPAAMRQIAEELRRSLRDQRALIDTAATLVD